MSLARIYKIDNSSPEVVAAMQRLCAFVSSNCPNAKLIVFGSCARNTMTAESDIDVAVILPDDCDLAGIKALYYKARLSSSFPVDALFFHNEYYKKRSTFGGVCVDIANSGKEIYPNWTLGETV